jgi:photosystem II stability/assembly factor-like uncharacterized protein
MIKVHVLLPVLILCAGGVCVAGDAQPSAGIVTASVAVMSRTLFLDAMARGEVMAVVGERGQILIAKTGGPWQRVTAPVDATLTSVYFHDDMLGWAAGHDAVILKTTDGGRHWRQVYHDPDRDSPILDLWFADKDYGIAIGAYGLYLVTTNGGETWTKDELHIVNEDIREAVEGDAQSTAMDDDAVAPDDLHLNAIARAEQGKLYIVAEAGHLFRSEDLGRAWQELPSPYNGSFFGVLPLGHESLLVFGLRGHLYRSDDNGLSWNRIETQTSETLTSALRLHDGSIVLTGMGGVVLTSNNQGRSFAVRELRYKHGYSAVIESGNGDVIIAGDHGIENWHRKDIGLAHE